MKRYLLLLFIFLYLPLHAQNFRINAGGAVSYFNNIYNRNVSFYGYSVNYSYYFYKKTGFYINFDHYFPATYYALSYAYDDPQVPVYITGGANALDLGLRFKIADPDSKKVELNTTLAISSFGHSGSYHIEESIVYDIRNSVKSLYAGMEFILKKVYIPFAISAGYNLAINQKIPYKNWDGSSVPFSSSIVIRAGISLPIMKGPVPANIKSIEY